MTIRNNKTSEVSQTSEVFMNPVRTNIPPRSMPTITCPIFITGMGMRSENVY